MLLTKKGVYDFDHPPDNYSLEEIGYSLSNQCRFLGHCTPYYSVAEHSVYVSMLLYKRSSGSVYLAKCGLLHDAHEAYVGDLPPVVRRAMDSSAYDQLAQRVAFAIRTYFDLPAALPREVKQIEEDLLAKERLWLFDRDGGDFGLSPKEAYAAWVHQCHVVGLGQ